MASSLERVQAVDPTLNAIVDLLADEALAAAHRADDARRRGDVLGPLHGVPVTVKVNVDTKGGATTNGVVAFKDNVAVEDSPVVADLRKAGALVIGRHQHASLLGTLVHPERPARPHLEPMVARNTPQAAPAGVRRRRWPPASAPSPMATIFAGSVRYPAYCTGVVGLRPCSDRVPAFLGSAKEERPLSMAMMSVQGPLARNVAECAWRCRR